MNQSISGGDTRGLQTIFSFFLGLMVTAFIGLGLYTFYPPPSEAYESELEELNRAERDADALVPEAERSEADRARILAIGRERDRIYDAIREESEEWGRYTSIALIILATIAMAVSLVRADRLPVVGNGLLLGGLFTMVYGVGWIIATDTSVARFVVMAFALVITLGLGWVRFVRRSATVPTTDAAGTGSAGGESEELRRRVARIEEQLRRAAEIFREP